MSNEGNGYPNPDPKHPISGRLERVRTEFGIKSKRAFHRLVSDGWEDSVSYEAVRNYHYDREPPPSYLARVAEVFDVRLAWLVADEGPMTEEERDLHDSTKAVDGRRWGEEHTEIVESTLDARVPALARAAVAREWRRLSVLASQSPATREDPAEILRKLCEAVAAPAESLGFDLSELRENDVTDYVIDVVRPVAAAWKIRLREQVSGWIEEESETQEG